MKFEEMKKFIETTPNAGFCMENLSEKLEDNGFIELYESKEWERPPKDIKGVFVVRGNSIIAVRIPKEDFFGFAGVLTHSDSPGFRIKRNAEIKGNGYIKLNVEPYGGAIYYSWLDKPLAICAQILNKDGMLGLTTTEDFGVIIPSQAIHINREVNSSNKINPQVDMCPIFDIVDGTESSLWNFIAEGFECEDEKSYAMDLHLYNPEPVKRMMLAGNEKHTLIVGPRLDNLTSVYAAFSSFINAQEMDGFAQVFVAYNSEEIGSMTNDGANGNFLTSVLERICLLYGAHKYTAFASSVMLSVDAAHAIHPNAPEKSDPTNVVKLGNGIVIKHNDNYAHDLGLDLIIREYCEDLQINCQDFYSRSDMRCGATLGNISMVHHGIRTLDIGIPMLAMHSAVETISENDIINLYDVLNEFYNHIYDIVPV